MNYEEFLVVNNNAKSSGKKETVDKVLFSTDRVSLLSGQSYPIARIVSAVSEGLIWLSNPSKLTNWTGFKKQKLDNNSKKQPKVEKKEKKSSNKSKKYPFELVEKDSNKVILRITAKDSLTVARYPYVQANWDYITVTRGKEHVLTVIKNDGTSYNFHWGESGYTLIGESDKQLKKAVIDFIEKEKFILLDWDDGSVHSASIFYNTNFNAWQLRLEGKRANALYGKINANVFEKFNNENEMMEYSKHFLKVKGWEKGIAQTGITVWNAKL